MNTVRLFRRQCCRSCYHGADNWKYQPCGCQDFERTVHPQLPDKNRNKQRQFVGDCSKLNRKSIRGKLISYYKPEKADDGWTGGNTGPVLNLPGKGESTRRVNHWTEACPSQQLSKEQSAKSTFLIAGRAGLLGFDSWVWGRHMLQAKRK